jgi:nucleotidyltransferase/DNA polymerase involved in DNA repair
MMREGSKLAMDIRAEIIRQTSFTVSIGIAPNKLLAKIGSQLNKPSSQSVILWRNVTSLMQQVPIMKLPKLGIKIGKDTEQLFKILGVVSCGDLHDETKFPVRELRRLLGSAGAGAEWLYRAARGFDNDPVKPTSS